MEILYITQPLICRKILRQNLSRQVKTSHVDSFPSITGRDGILPILCVAYLGTHRMTSCSSHSSAHRHSHSNTHTRTTIDAGIHTCVAILQWTLSSRLTLARPRTTYSHSQVISCRRSSEARIPWTFVHVYFARSCA